MFVVDDRVASSKSQLVTSVFATSRNHVVPLHSHDHSQQAIHRHNESASEHRRKIVHPPTEHPYVSDEIAPKDADTALFSSSAFSKIPRTPHANDDQRTFTLL
jgi:hypothetical protein